MRDWLVVLKDGTRVMVRAECPAERSLKGDEITFGPDGGTVTAVFAPDTVAYYFDAASCAVIVDGAAGVHPDA